LDLPKSNPNASQGNKLVAVL
jgi:hypothetical protein